MRTNESPGLPNEMMISPDESVELLIKSEETEVVSLLPISRKSVAKLGHHLPSFPTDRRGAVLNDTIPDRDKNGPPRVSFGIRGRGEGKDRDEHLNVAISLHVLLGIPRKLEFGHDFDRSDSYQVPYSVIKRLISNQFFDLSKRLILIFDFFFFFQIRILLV